MLLLNPSAVSSGSETAYVGFLKTFVLALFNRKTANIVLLEWLEQLSKVDTFMNKVVNQIQPGTVFIRLAASFIKHLVFSTIDECRLAQRYVETDKVDKTCILLPST